MPWTWVVMALLSTVPVAGPQEADALQVQVMLDRAGFSPGAIDGRMGMNTKKARALLKASARPSPPSHPPPPPSLSP